MKRKLAMCSRPQGEGGGRALCTDMGLFIDSAAFLIFILTTHSITQHAHSFMGYTGCIWPLLLALGTPVLWLPFGGEVFTSHYCHARGTMCPTTT